MTAANGPTDGGSTQTLLGLNFGWTDSTPSMSIDERLCTTTSWTTTTSVMCTQPAGTGAAKLVSISVSGLIVNSYGWFTFDGALGCCRFRCTIAVHVAIKMRSRGLIDGVVQLQC